ncbi:DsbA family protein [Corynebacterium oculi]|uniref:Disulfide bond formation protein D n=1 Tax=Corynebacterium oculi TaxID=1544416 RepID=A0A0Q0Z4S4_9CORY|nr:thioredoxin domain-containing protein [Corynebacterium oculi]KQB84457.1 Disulfide bond formation protein D precursor [Corynebacterium oculi]
MSDENKPEQPSPADKPSHSQPEAASSAAQPPVTENNAPASPAASSSPATAPEAKAGATDPASAAAVGAPAGDGAAAGDTTDASTEQPGPEETGVPEKKDSAEGPTPGWAKAAIGVLTVLALTAGAGGFALGKITSGSDATLPEAEAAYIGGPSGPLTSPADIHRLNPDDPFAMGSQDAKVIVSYFSDFSCPVCANFSQEIEPKIIDEYVNDGRVRLEWNDFPFLGDASILAAQGGRAAAAQGKFWEFKDAVYGGFEGNEHPEYTVDDLVGFAEQAGVPHLDKFRADVESGKFASTAMNALIYGGYLGVNGTPTFVVNGVPLMSTDYDSLKKAIEQSLQNGQPDAPVLPEQGAEGAEGTAPGEATNGEDPAPAEG